MFKGSSCFLSNQSAWEQDDLYQMIMLPMMFARQRMLILILLNDLELWPFAGCLASQMSWIF
jgi:hypothetical protein